MSSELGRLGLDEEETNRAYERIVLKRAVEILRKRVKPSRNLLSRYLHRLGVAEYEIENVIRRLEQEAEK